MAKRDAIALQFRRLVDWRVEPQSKGRYRMWRDEFGYWLVASRHRIIAADLDPQQAWEAAQRDEQGMQ